MLMKKISEIEFGVLGPSMVRKMSALEVRTPDTYDKDGYPMESGLMDPHLGVINPGLRCKTCGQRMKTCPGHFGHLELVRPVVNAQFSKNVEQLLHATCKECGKIALPQEKLDQLKALIDDPTVDLAKKIVLRTKKVKKCPHCNAMREAVMLDKPTNFYYDKERLYPTQVREWLEKIPAEDLPLMGYNPEKIKPAWFVLTVVQIPPITIRPSITLDTGIKSEDDLTHKLVDIIRINMRLKDNIDAGAPQLIIEDLWDLLQYHVTTYFDNNTAGVPPAKHRSGRALRTLVQRLKGKKGRFRYNLTGKRVNFAARSVITPDSYLSINELGVPQEIANNLTVPEFVTKWNLNDIKKLVKNSEEVLYVVRPNGMRKKLTESNRAEIVDEIEVGFRVERKLTDGDIVLFNRQPSLHRLSMLAHKVKIMPGRTLRLNPIVCKPYNADFDGDEMNMHVPQTEEGKIEAKELMYVENQIISPRYGAPVIILDEDGVSGTYILTMKTTKLRKDEVMRYFHMAGNTEIPKPDRGKEYSGKIVLSQLLPEDLNLEYESHMCKVIQKSKKCKECTKEKCPYDAYVVIKNGKLEAGVVDGKSLGEGKGALVDSLARDYPPQVIERFYTVMGQISADLISRKGMTVGLDEYESAPELDRKREKAIKIHHEESEELEKQFKAGKLELVPGRSLEESFELKMMRIAAKTKDAIEKEILDQRIENALSEKPDLNSGIMILSGSRGNAVNLTNISGFWGQAAVREGRPKRGFKDRVIALNKKGDVGAIAGGFIDQNFMQGMTSRQYFFHSMGGRQGEVDTGVSTKVSGYLYRRLANSLKDLTVKNDETVRSASNNIIQYNYGEDAVFPENSNRGKNIEVKKEAEKLFKR